MRITEAAQCLGISPRMLRYRESLGLLPPVRTSPVRDGVGSHCDVDTGGHSAGRGLSRLGTPQTPTAPDHRWPGTPRSATVATGHRQFSPADLDAVSLGLAIEQRYDISPAALAFGLRVLADPAARAQVAELGSRIGRIRPLPAMALDFEKERAQRLLSPGHSGVTRRT